MGCGKSKHAVATVSSTILKKNNYNASNVDPKNAKEMTNSKHEIVTYDKTNTALPMGHGSCKDDNKHNFSDDSGNVPDVKDMPQDKMENEIDAEKENENVEEKKENDNVVDVEVHAENDQGELNNLGKDKDMKIGDDNVAEEQKPEQLTSQDSYDGEQPLSSKGDENTENQSERSEYSSPHTTEADKKEDLVEEESKDIETKNEEVTNTIEDNHTEDVEASTSENRVITSGGE